MLCLCVCSGSAAWMMHICGQQVCTQGMHVRVVAVQCACGFTVCLCYLEHCTAAPTLLYAMVLAYYVCGCCSLCCMFYGLLLLTVGGS